MKPVLLIVTLGVVSHIGHAQQTDAAHQGIAIVPVASPARTYDLKQITRGRILFHKYCAACHGVNAEGAPNWRQRNPDGKFPPPPLNGTGHTWHHPMKALRMTIRDGTQKIGGKMPAWGHTLSDQDIDDIIAWFQGRWPDEIYQAWFNNNEKYASK